MCSLTMISLCPIMIICNVGCVTIHVVLLGLEEKITEM